MSPSSPTSSWSGAAGRFARPGKSTKFTPSLEVHSQDSARTPSGALGSAATASQWFCLWAVTKMLPYLSTATAGSYPPHDSKVGNRTGVPNVGPDDAAPAGTASVAGRSAAATAV